MRFAVRATMCRCMYVWELSAKLSSVFVYMLNISVLFISRLIRSASYISVFCVSRTLHSTHCVVCTECTEVSSPCVHIFLGFTFFFFYLSCVLCIRVLLSFKFLLTRDYNYFFFNVYISVYKNPTKRFGGWIIRWTSFRKDCIRSEWGRARGECVTIIRQTNRGTIEAEATTEHNVER